MAPGVERDIKGSSTNKTLKALVVDDTSFERAMHGHFLRILKFEVIEAVNLEDAVDRVLSGETFDLIIMGKSRPIIDGIEATRELKEMGGMIKIIAVADTEYSDAFLAAGADEFLPKPLELEALGEVLKKIDLFA